MYYNIDKVKDFGLVMAPPYDVISEQQQRELHTKSSNNFAHIDLAKKLEGDDDKNNCYTRAKGVFEQWLKDEVIVKDNEEAIYFYQQEYTIHQQKYKRLGFIALMDLTDRKDSKVCLHEKTHANIVDDRLELTKALNTNLSCIFVCYSDTQRRVEKIFNTHICSQKPVIEVVDADGIVNKVWRLTDEAAITEISQSIEGQNVFIADGHHRYQVACEYREFCRAQKGISEEKQAYDYVMTYFTNMDAKDLQIFPMHRIVRKFPEDMNFLEEFFSVDKIKTQEELLIMLAKAGHNEHFFGLYTKKGIYLVGLKNKTLLNQLIKEGSEEYKNLDATILKNLVLDRIGISSDDSIIYTKDLTDVISKVDEGEYEAGFIMNAVKIQQLKIIALNDEKMPPKTTYFYPKVLSGLTVYNMD